MTGGERTPGASRRTRARRCAFLAAFAAFVASGVAPVGAHEVGGSADGIVPFAAVLLLTTSVAAAGGLLALGGATRLAALAPPTRRRVATAFGLALMGLGVSVLVPVAATGPGVAVVGVTVGSAGGWWLLHGSHAFGGEWNGRAGAVSGALALHRVVEGVALAAVYAAGDALGAVAVLLLTLHATVESVAVGVEYGAAGRRVRGATAVLLLQAGFALSATAALAATGSPPTVVRGLVLTGVAGLLIVFGGHELRRHAAGVAGR